MAANFVIQRLHRDVARRVCATRSRRRRGRLRRVGAGERIRAHRAFRWCSHWRSIGECGGSLPQCDIQMDPHRRTHTSRDRGGGGLHRRSRYRRQHVVQPDRSGRQRAVDRDRRVTRPKMGASTNCVGLYYGTSQATEIVGDVHVMHASIRLRIRGSTRPTQGRRVPSSINHPDVGSSVNKNFHGAKGSRTPGVMQRRAVRIEVGAGFTLRSSAAQRRDACRW
jgi:hypothetical protein